MTVSSDGAASVPGPAQAYGVEGVVMWRGQKGQIVGGTPPTTRTEPQPPPRRRSEDTGPGTHVHRCTCGKAWPGSDNYSGDTGPR